MRIALYEKTANGPSLSKVVISNRLSVSRDLVTLDSGQLRYNTYAHKWTYAGNNEPRAHMYESWAVLD